MNPTPQNICLTKDVNFLTKSYGEWAKIEKTVVVPISYDGSDEKEIELIPANDNSNNYYNLIKH